MIAKINKHLDRLKYTYFLKGIVSWAFAFQREFSMVWSCYLISLSYLDAKEVNSKTDIP